MPNEVEHLGLVHAATLAIMERSALITTAFTTKGKQIMHVRPEYRKLVDTEDGVPPTIDQLVLDLVGRSHRRFRAIGTIGSINTTMSMSCSPMKTATIPRRTS